MNRSEAPPAEIPDDEPPGKSDPFESIDPELPAPVEERASTADSNPIGGVPLNEEEGARLDELCSKFNSSWESGNQEPNIDAFVSSDLDIGLQQCLVRRLVMLDIEHREKRDKSLPPGEYLSRLPGYRDAVEATLSECSPSVGHGGRSPTVRVGKSILCGEQPPHANDPTSRYRPTKLHDRGGLGAVYWARDMELNRVVALKEILPEHSDNLRYQEKFVLEAEVTGSLEHPGIVPVYGLGRYEDDLPYYAMRFIRGRSLRDSIREFHKQNPTPSANVYLRRDFRKLLRHLIETCYAIGYAHKQGVLHRDIKPNNIMLGDDGETLVVDWGLAKLIGSKTSADDLPTQIGMRGSGSNTRTGSAVGTPMYMSPEQAFGHNDQLDGRSDVYALGVVLFNMVTGGHPVEGRNTNEVLTNVRAGNTKSADSLAASAPPALASICRKAMELEPANRYATPVEMADDIERWMSDEVVQAHVGHETIIERAGRLIRRYRSWTISGAAAMLVITTVAVASALLINQAKEKERVAKLEAREFKQDAVARYRDSRDAIDTWLVQSSDALEFFPGTQSVRKRLLELAIEDYERLSRRESRDPELELERGRALVKVGDLTQMQHDYDSASSHYNAALKLFATDVDDDELSARFQCEHGNVHTRIGIAWAAQGKTAEAEREFEAAIVELTQLADETQEPLPRRLLAVAHVNAGELYSSMGATDAAVQHLDEALRQYESSPLGSDSKRELGMARTRELLGRIYRDQGQHEKGLVYFNEAVEALQRLVSAEPDHPGYLDALASAYISEASSFRTRGLERQKLDALNSAVGHYRALRTAMPDVPRYTENLAITLTDLGLAKHESGFSSEAEPVLEEARELLTVLSASYGLVPRFREELAGCEDALGQVLLDSREEADEANEVLKQALWIYQRVEESGQLRPQLYERLAITQSHYAQALYRNQEIEKAEQCFGGAISTLKQLIEIEGMVPRFSNALAHVHHRLAMMLHDQKDEKASVHFQTARDLWMGIDVTAASYAHDLAWLLATCPVESIRDSEASLRYANQAVDLAPDNARYVTTLALSELLSGHKDEAFKLLDQAKSLRGYWIDRDLFVLAIAQHRAGQTDKAQESFTNADQWMEEHEPYNADILWLRQMTASLLEDEAS